MRNGEMENQRRGHLVLRQQASVMQLVFGTCLRMSSHRSLASSGLGAQAGNLRRRSAASSEACGLDKLEHVRMRILIHPPAGDFGDAPKRGSWFWSVVSGEWWVASGG